MKLSRFFYFSRKNRKGLIILASLILLPSIFLFLVKKNPKNNYPKKSFEEFSKELTKIQLGKIDTIQLKNLNFNRLDYKDLLKLGFNQLQIKEILALKKNLKRIQSAKNLDSLESLRFALPYLKSSLNFKDKTVAKTKLKLNKASFKALLKLIGNYKQTQIFINYRNKLGGLASFDQLKEIKYLSNQSKSKLKLGLLDKENLKQINLQTANFRRLIQHPYIDKKLTKKILWLRKNENLNQTTIGRIIEELPELRPYIKY